MVGLSKFRRENEPNGLEIYGLRKETRNVQCCGWFLRLLRHEVLSGEEEARPPERDATLEFEHIAPYRDAKVELLETVVQRSGLYQADVGFSYQTQVAESAKDDASVEFEVCALKHPTPAPPPQSSLPHPPNRPR
ncbi:MAG TPA: hypothetical protein DHW63_12090 [Hyphomonadaceae bacterium]|nr:hypothetical protein [Hyphomonadaceae bacterium]